MFALPLSTFSFGKFLYSMVRIRVSDRVNGRVRVRDRVWFYVGIFTVSSTYHCVANVVIMYTAVMCLSLADYITTNNTLRLVGWSRSVWENLIMYIDSLYKPNFVPLYIGESHAKNWTNWHNFRGH